MSELCLLGFHERARQGYLFNGQIPRNCLDCIQAEVDKPPVQLRLTFIGVRGLINVVEMIKALDADKTVNIGLKWDDVHGRTVKFVRAQASAHPEDKDCTYETFHCSRPVAGVARTREINNVDTGGYL